MGKILAQSIKFGDITINGPSQDRGGMFNLSSAKIGDIVGASLNLVLATAGIGLLLMIISSGYTLMMSAGDAKKAAASKASLTNSIVGFLLIFGAFWITQIIGVVFGWENYIGTMFSQ